MNAPATITLPTFADVEAAAQRLAGIAVRTPLLNFAVLDERLGARVFLKAETLQRMGAFKFRGAYNKISRSRRTSGPPGWWRSPPAITRRAWRSGEALTCRRPS